ncbi:hypothetical protein GCM10027294_19870 [Marinactinospora endophytica]
MTTSTTAPPAASPLASIAALALTVVGGVAIGVLTSFGQGWLPSALNSLANSAGSWSVAALLLALLAPRRWAAVVAGVLALAAMMAGYDLASVLRGFSVSAGVTLFWVTAAVVVGPFLGLTAHALRFRTAFAPYGVGLLSGVLVGEGAYGLLYILATTSGVYWAGSIAAGSALLAWGCVWRFRDARSILAAVAVAAVTAVAFVVVYSGDLLIWWSS